MDKSPAVLQILLQTLDVKMILVSQDSQQLLRAPLIKIWRQHSSQQTQDFNSIAERKEKDKVPRIDKKLKKIKYKLVKVCQQWHKETESVLRMLGIALAIKEISSTDRLIKAGKIGIKGKPVAQIYRSS